MALLTRVDAQPPELRYPRLLANQINWNAEMYASAVTVTRRRKLLVHDYRLQLARFAAAIARPMPGARTPNLGRGCQFHYDPDRRDTAGINLDPPEYANIVLQAIAHYDRALRMGMPPLPRSSMRRLRAWVTRVVAGRGRTPPISTGTPARDIGASIPRSTGRSRCRAWRRSPCRRASGDAGPEGRWAKALFDRGLLLYRRLADDNGGPLAPKHVFGVYTLMESHDCFCSRMLGNVARAIALGMGLRPAADPPPLYAYDYDTGRLAVTTPRYSTAIVPDARGVVRYGGIEPARLFGPGQRVAANLGGTPPGAFGIAVSDGRGHRVLASQSGRPGTGAALRLVRSPRGRLTHPRPYPAKPYACPFSVLEARGTIARRRLRISSSLRFRPASIDSRWRVSCTGRCGPYRVQAHFPTAGANAVIEVVRRDGSRARLSGDGVRVPLADVASVSLGSGYRIVDLDGPAHAMLVSVPVDRQRTNPDFGPSLAVELVARRRFHERSLAARIVLTA